MGLVPLASSSQKAFRCPFTEEVPGKKTVSEEKQQWSSRAPPLIALRFVST